MRQAIIICALVVLIKPLGLRAQTKAWPLIQPYEASVIIDFENVKHSADTPFIALIKGRAGAVLYRLDCHNFYYEDESMMDYSGDFQCALFPMKGQKLIGINVLAANTEDEISSFWWNRGRLRSEQLRGECLNFPEYSTSRHFKLRRMLVTFEFTDIQWSNERDKQNNPLLKRFTFHVKATPDAAAKSSRAELPSGRMPPQSCYP